MPRKVSTGRVGGPVLGSLSTSTNTFSSVEPNANIIFAPDGSGVVQSNSDIQTNAQSGIRLADSDSSNYIRLIAPGAVSSNVTLTLPSNDGDANQVLTTNGSGVLSWDSTTLSVTDRTAADGNKYYLAMVDEASKDSGNEDTLSIATGRLEFQPNPGRLTVNTISVTTLGCTGTSTLSTVDIHGGNIDGTTIGASSRGAGSFGTLVASTITEDSSIALKENVSNIDNALESISKLVGVTYDRKDGSSVNEAGLIAEEVNKVLPNIVKRDDNGNPQSIAYTKLTAYLIEAVKTLKAEVDNLKGK